MENGIRCKTFFYIKNKYIYGIFNQTLHKHLRDLPTHIENGHQKTVPLKMNETDRLTISTSISPPIPKAPIRPGKLHNFSIFTALIKFMRYTFPSLIKCLHNDSKELVGAASNGRFGS